MKTINSISALKQEIALLEVKQTSNRKELKEEAMMVYDSLMPINLLKSTLSKFTSSPELRGNLLNSTMGIGAGYLTKKIITGESKNIFKHFFGTLLQVGITNIVSKNGDSIKSKTVDFLRTLFVKKNESQQN